MCRRLILLAGFVMALGMVGSVRAATLFHWTMDGPPDTNIVVETDIVSDVNAYAFESEDGPGESNELSYGPPNPWYNTGGTSADFQNDRTDNIYGYGLVALDTGLDCPVDLSTLTQVTIECFVYPYMREQGVVVRKNNSPGDGGIYYIDVRGGGEFAVRLCGPNDDIGDGGGVCNDMLYDPCSWYHVALVWDGNYVTFYVNGQQSQDLSGAPQVPFTGPIGDSCKALGIGCLERDCMTDINDPERNTGQFFHGRIDEVRISDTALSPKDFLHPGFAKLASMAQGVCNGSLNPPIRCRDGRALQRI